MKVVVLTSAIVGAAGIFPEAVFGRIALTEPFWLAVWGLALILIANTVRGRSRARKFEPRKQAARIETQGLETVNGVGLPSGHDANPMTLAAVSRPS
jgi:hypothetical protein